MEPLPLETQTLYADLLEQLTMREAGRSIGDLTGSFLTKRIKDHEYWYFQHSEPGGRRRQIYLGPDSPALQRLVAQSREERSGAAPDHRGTQRLCSMLAASGAHVTDHSSARVLHALLEGMVFRTGGVLVGTQAFGLIGNLLGVRWSRASLRTQDVDIAVEQEIQVGLPDLQADVPGALETLQLGFLPVPPFDPRRPSTSFKVRGKALRVDLLTPARGPATTAVPIRRLNAAAYPLRYLDFLIETATVAAVLAGRGFLVRVPDPARFALHKLVTAGERQVSFETKATKDLFQAAQVLETLAENRPGDLLLAYDAATLRADGLANRIRTGLERLERTQPDTARRIRTLLGLVDKPAAPVSDRFSH